MIKSETVLNCKSTISTSIMNMMVNFCFSVAVLSTLINQYLCQTEDQITCSSDSKVTEIEYDHGKSLLLFYCGFRQAFEDDQVKCYEEALFNFVSKEGKGSYRFEDAKALRQKICSGNDLKKPTEEPMINTISCSIGKEAKKQDGLEFVGEHCKINEN